MRAFEQKLLDSDADAAFYWNAKESSEGAWSRLVRRRYLGELPSGIAAGIELRSHLSPGEITPQQNITLPKIEWVGRS